MVGTIQPAPVTAAVTTLNVSYTLEGCNLDHGATFNNDGTVTCTDNGYTTGDLGKGWAELDLVPHRVTLGNGSNSAQSGSFIVAGDYRAKAGDAFLGWDAIGAEPGEVSAAGPHLNIALSDATCAAITWGPTVITPAGSGVGGANQTIYRLVSASIPANTTCVYDYWQRLALGAHLFNGSSLQSNLWAPDLTNNNVGQKRVQLPVAQLLPPTITKDMSASAPIDYAWDLQKQPSPASLDFGNVCAANAPTSLPLSVSVTWQRLAATPGAITVITHVYAANVAHRDLTITATDSVYSGTTLLYTINGTATNVPANTANVLVLSDTRTVPANTTGLNDSATATVTDTFTGLPVAGTLGPVTKTATVQQGSVTNASAAIADSEAITGAGLTFSVASPASGSFSVYTAGTHTTGPVVWNSGTVGGNGSITFGKTVYVPAQTVATGTLSDTATLTGSDGFTTSASASVTIASHAAGTVTINKTIPNVLQGTETQTFTFHVLDAASVDHTATITFAAGETSKSTSVPDLPLGTTRISEDAATGWAPQDPQTINLGCLGSVTFLNTFVPATAQVAKTTNPPGTSSWDMVLTGPGTPVGGVHATAVAGAGFVPFNFALQEGAYTITETPQSGYDQGAAVGCAFTVSYPADFSRVFSCRFTNIERGTIIVKKVTDPASATDLFTFTGDAAGSIANGGEIVVGDLVPDTYTSTEAAATGWDLTGISCDDGSSTTPSTTDLATRTATFQLDPGETITCTFTNTERGSITVKKVTDPTSATDAFDFTGDVTASLSNGQSRTVGNLVAGTYSSTEAAKAGWDLTGISCSNAHGSGSVSTRTATFNLHPGESITCTFTNTERASVDVTKTFKGGAIPAGYTFTFQIRHGASQGTVGNPNEGTILNTVNVTSATPQPFHLGTNLVPGDYQVCEAIPGPAWNMSIALDPNAFMPNVDTAAFICVPITLTAGQAASLSYDNAPPPGGIALTIGYWKTHASCSMSKGTKTTGSPALDAALAKFPVAVNQTKPGFYVGTLYVDTCQEAVSLLSKRAIDSTKQISSDPTINFAAQYVAYELNIVSGAATNPQAANAAANGQAILVAVHFDGTAAGGLHDTLTAAQASSLNSDAMILDKFNNDTL